MKKMSVLARVLSVLLSMALLCCLMPAFAVSAAEKTEVTVTLSHVANASGANGFYFTVSPADALPYNGNWSERPVFTEGGVYLSDGTLLQSTDTLVKLSANLYYVGLLDNGHTATAGEFVYVDGVVETEEVKVTYTRTAFRFNGSSKSWSVVEDPTAPKTTETVTIIESVDAGNTTNGFYFMVETADSLPFNGDWSVRYSFVSGGITSGETYLTHPKTVAKYAAQRYYVDLASNNVTVTDGITVVIDGVIESAAHLVTFPRTEFQYSEANAGWSIIAQETPEEPEEPEDDSKEKVNMTLSEYLGAGSTNGLYFQTAEENELVAAGSESWDTARHTFTGGGIYVKETGATLTHNNTFTKVSSTRYYIDLASNGVTVTDGTVIVVDGYIDTETVRIVFPYTEFIYDAAASNWYYVKPKTEPTDVTVVMREVTTATGADYFYFLISPCDPLPFDGGWQEKYNFSEGGVYAPDGTLINPANFIIKLTEYLYCVHIKTGGYTANDGDIFIVDGVIESDGAKVTYPRTAYQFDAESGAWAMVEEPKTETTVTLKVGSNASGGNGFYFTVSPSDPLPYDGGWDARYVFAEGGVYLENGVRLIGSKTLAKLSQSQYYLGLRDSNHVAVDGERITVDGTVISGPHTVHFERTVFQYDGTTQTWSIVPAFEGAQVTLSDKLDTAFAMTIPDALAAKNPEVKFTVGSTVTRVPMPEQSEDGFYFFHLPVDAKDMATTVNAKLMDGETVVTEKTYSLREYAQTLLEGQYAGEYRAIAKAMLNYGAVTQNYFGYNTANLANRGYEFTTEWNTVNTAGIPDMLIEGPAAGYIGATLLLNDTVGVRLYFSEPVEGATALDDYYYIQLDGVTANDLATVQTVTVGDTTYSFSVLSLAKKVIAGNYSEKFIKLAKSLVLYSDAVEKMMDTPLFLHEIGTAYPYHDSAKAYLESVGGNVADFMNGSGDAKEDIVIRWEDNTANPTGYTVLLSTNADYSNAVTYTLAAGVKSLPLSNLYKDTTYYVKVTANGTAHVDTMTFHTTDLGPRVMDVDGVFNVRDLGGYQTVDGKTTLQGLIYRGGALQCTEQNVKITEEGIRTMAEVLGIKTEIDIRTIGEAEGITKSFIPGAKLVYYTQSGYKQTLTHTAESVANTFRLLARPENYPVYFHCTAGADRTGTLAYLINALLGVDEATLIKDYEFTSFSIYGERNSQTTELTFYELEDYVKSLAGDTLAEKVEGYLLSIGVTADEIANVRAIMTGGETVDLPHFTLDTPSDQDNTLKVLAIGNSFSMDSMDQLWRMFYSTGYESVVLGNLVIGGCYLDKHYDNMVNDIAAYQYWYNDRNSWVVTENANLLEKLKSEDWDIISIQQVSQDSGRPETFGNLQNIIDFLKANEIGNAEIYWNMTWAYQQDTAHSGFANYNRDQMTMYNAIVNAVQTTILPNEQINGVFAPGTTIQNLRTALGDILTRDGYHLSLDIGRYAASLTWYCTITGNKASTVKWVPANTSEAVTPYLDVIHAAVDAALANPYEITDLS